MKNCILISILFLVTLSCNNSNNEKLAALTGENKKLRNQVEVLRDSLSSFEEDFLYSQILLGIADRTVLKVGEKNNIAVVFQTFNKKLPEYEIYKIEGNEKTRVGSNTNTRFDYSFTPKSLDDNNLKLLVKMPYKGKVIEIPAEMNFDLKQ